MKVSYFPGCTLRTKAKELDVQARACAKKLGVELCEIENWQCCGGVFVTARDEIATKLSSVRAPEHPALSQAFQRARAEGGRGCERAVGDGLFRVP